MIVLIAGPIAVGKTTVAAALAERIGADVVRARYALAEILKLELSDRAALQMEGADLDRRTNGHWLKDYLAQLADDHQSIVVDSLRTQRQTLPILHHFVDSRLVYLDAHESTRRQRYTQASRSDRVKATTGFDVAMNHPTELRVGELRPMAHLHLETDSLEVAATVQEIENILPEH